MNSESLDENHHIVRLGVILAINLKSHDEVRIKVTCRTFYATRGWFMYG